MHIQATTSQTPIQIDYTQISFPDRYDKEQFETLLRHPTVLERFKIAMSDLTCFVMVKKKHAAVLLDIEEANVPTIIFYKRETDLKPKIYALFDKAIIGGNKIVKKMTPLEKDGLSYVQMVPKHCVHSGFLEEWIISKQLIQKKIESIVDVDLVCWDIKDRLIAEHYPFGELTHYINQLEISPIYPGFECLDVIIQLATILESLHAHGFSHLDLKMPNIFVKPNGDTCTITLGDLRTVANISAGKVELCTTYPPPEVKVHEEITPYPGIDLWALGLILSYLKNRKFREKPFAFDQIRKKIGKKALKLHRAALQKEKHPWNQLILKLLSPNKNERRSATEVKNFFLNEMKKSDRSTIDTNRNKDLRK